MKVVQLTPIGCTTRFTYQKTKTSKELYVYANNRMVFLEKKQQFSEEHMRDYSEFPPINYFIRILKNCPKCALLYVQIWKKKGKFMKISVHKSEVRKEFLVSPTMFRNLLVPLMFLNVIVLNEVNGIFEIDVLGKAND